MTLATSSTTAGAFITGTDTGVGKTLITAALARRCAERGRRVGVMKPIETGVDAQNGGTSDARRLMQAARSTVTIDQVSPYRLTRPLAPLSAAEAEGRHIEMERIAASYRELAQGHDLMLVEGAGGVLVPLTPERDNRDLMLELGLPVVVVGLSHLGGINQARMTIEVLRAAGLRVLALVLNRTTPAADELTREQEHSTVDCLRRTVGLPICGPLPFCPSLDADWEGARDAMAGEPALIALAALIDTRPHTIARPL